MQFAVCLAACLACLMKKANHNDSKIDRRDGRSVFINHCVLSCTWSIIWGNLAEYKASFFSFKPFPSISVPKKNLMKHSLVLMLHLLQILTASAASSVVFWSFKEQSYTHQH